VTAGLLAGGGAGRADNIPPWHGPQVGERLGFQCRWMGIPVGSGSIQIKARTVFEGHPALELELQGETNQFLSAFYPIRDTLRAYVDPSTWRPLQIEKDQREGDYRAHEIVRFDHAAGLAHYRSLVNSSEKQIPVPELFQDLLGGFYWFRAQPLEPGRDLTMRLYTDEKIYDTRVRIGKVFSLELLKRGTFSCLEIEPQAAFKGILVKRGRIWAYLTADAHRLPVLVKISTPWGPMAAILHQASIPLDLRPAAR
jgi:hypothetical protein